MQLIADKGTSLYRAFGIHEGVIALVGGGGKTSTMLCLARELCPFGKVLVTTSTHIFPPASMCVLHDPDEAVLRRAFSEENPICIGIPEPSGKFAAPSLPVPMLASIADFVLVEADGAKGMPLKAPAAHEPVIPASAELVIAVAGLDGIGKTVAETAFRAELYAGILGCDGSHIVTPSDVAGVLCSTAGQYKNVRAGMRFAVLLNKADDPLRVELAKEVALSLNPDRVERVIIASCEEMLL